SAFGRARTLSTEEELHTAALRALMRRAYSIHDMREYLARRAAISEHVGGVIARLREQRYLDDERYALEFTRQHAQSRRQGRFRIMRELRARGVPDKHIEPAMDAIFAETDETTLIRARVDRLLARARGPLDEKARASMFRSLLRAGFSPDAIGAELRLRKGAAAKLSADDHEE